uniref:Uncharacterized protein n=1 Tax=Anguilla anguilla TaxID=7936 RepID=A0A0E9WRL1_ANGAN
MGFCSIITVKRRLWTSFNSTFILMFLSHWVCKSEFICLWGIVLIFCQICQLSC